MIIAAGLVLLSAGCSNRPELELNYRNSFKKIWDKAMTDTGTARRKIDMAYSAGDIATAADGYKKLGLTYVKARENTRRLKEPQGYENIQKLVIGYFNEGASYYTSTARIIEDSGGNYNSEQESELKTQEKKWNTASDELEKALKAKKIQVK